MVATHLARFSFSPARRGGFFYGEKACYRRRSRARRLLLQGALDQRLHGFRARWNPPLAASPILNSLNDRPPQSNLDRHSLVRRTRIMGHIAPHPLHYLLHPASGPSRRFRLHHPRFPQQARFSSMFSTSVKSASRSLFSLAFPAATSVSKSFLSLCAYLIVTLAIPAS